MVKGVSALFYRFEVSWLPSLTQPANLQSWQQVNLIVLLNHTSLFEPLFVRLAPTRFLWRLSADLVVPGADITLKRPIAGRLLRIVVPGCIPISRLQDDTWQQFLAHVTEHKVNAILPEGRMKRKSGLDKHGNNMSVRGGIADMLQRLEQGKILFVYSGGLHHIQAPGDKLPKLFKTIKANLELVDIAEYKQLMAQHADSFKNAVMADMNQRLRDNIPS